MCTSEKISKDNLAGYREHILEDTQYINLQGMPLLEDRYGRRISMYIPLDRVYIRIQAIEEKQSLAQQRAEERQLEKGQRPEYEYRQKGYFDYIHELGEHLYRQAQIYQKTESPEAVDPLEALKKHKRMVILGAPGSGKSTLLRYVARKAVQDNTNIPILIPLREYAAVLRDETIPLDDFALKQMSKENGDLHQLLKDAIEAGHVLWLLDALDEAQPWGEKITRQVRELKGSMIITSRPIGYTNVGLENLTHFEVLPLISDHIEQFLSDWFGIIAEKLDEGPDWIEDRKTRFEDQLAKRPRIRPLTYNPLLLTFLVILAGTYKWQDFPDLRAQLYKRYVEELLSSWEYERRGKDHEGESVFTLGPLTGEDAKKCALNGFYYLGWYMHLLYYGGKPETIPTRKTITSAVARYVSRKYENKSDTIANAIVRFWMEAGILSVWNLEGNEYLTFRHLTFQEYAASWGLAEIWKRDPRKAWKFLRPRLHYYAWREPILLLAGMQEKQHVNDLARHVLKGKSHYERVLHRDLRLIIALLGEGAPLDQKLRKSVIQLSFKLIRYYPLKRRTTLLFTYAIGLLVIIFELPSLWFYLWTLAWILSFKIPVIQIQNILTLPVRIWQYPARELITDLGQIHEAVPHLINALSDSDYHVREGAATALGQIGAPEAVPHLINALSDSDYHVRERAATALGQIGALEAVPHLINALNDSDDDVRGGAATALGQIGVTEAVPHLINAFRDSRGLMRERAATALGQIPEAVPYLINALNDSDFLMRGTAATALGQIGALEAVPHLINALKDSDELSYSDDYVRGTAAIALGQIGALEAVPHLINTLSDSDKLRVSDDMVRKSAAIALGQIGAPEAVPHLINALNDSDVYVCGRAATALGQIESSEAVPHLINALNVIRSYVRERAATALGQIGAPEAVPHLINALNDIDYQVRWSAAIALGEIGAPEAVPHLINALNDINSYVCESAAIALGQIGAPEAVPHLINALNDRDVYMRGRAATALGQIHEAVPHLINALNDRDYHVREGAATALGQLANVCSDSGKLKEIASKLWWRLTDNKWVARNAYDSIEKVATQQSKLEVEGLPFDDPLISTLVKLRSEWLLYTLYILSAILVAMLPVISSILIEQLKQPGSVGFKIFILIVAVIIVAALIGALKLLVKRIEEEKQKVR